MLLSDAACMRSGSMCAEGQDIRCVLFSFIQSTLDTLYTHKYIEYQGQK